MKIKVNKSIQSVFLSLWVFAICLTVPVGIKAQTYCNNPLGTITPTGTWQTLTAPAHGYYTFTATVGCTYTFTMCGNGGSYSGDPYLTLSSGPTSGGYTWNDDFCGLGSQVTWLSTVSGVVYLNVGTCCSSMCGAFSGIRNVAYMVTCPTPAPPPAPTANANPSCGPTFLNTMTPPAGITYYWQGTNPTGTSTANPTSATFPVTVSGTYYVRAYNPSNTSWSTTSSSIVVTVNALPAPPPAPTVVQTPACFSTNLNPISGAPTGVTYYWQGTLATGTSTANPATNPFTVTASGTYYVRARHSGGCWSVADSAAVVILPAPAPPNVAANNPACIGQTLRLSATGTGTSYVWSGPNGFTSVDSVATVNNVSIFNGGIYSVYAIAQGCTATTAATINISVSPSPASPIASSNAPVCENGLLNLFATIVPGASYQWVGPNGFTANTQNATLNPALITSGGIYSVYSVVSSCSSLVATTTVIVNPIPTAPVLSSNIPVCTGGNLSLSATGPGGANYSWTGPNAFASNLQNPLISNVTLAATGIYSATAIVNGCSSTIATLNVNVLAAPAPIAPSSNSPICEGQAINLSSTSAGAGTYEWTGPNGFTANVQNPIIAVSTLSDAGTYTVYALENGCLSPGTTLLVQVQPAPVIPSVGSNSPVCTGSNLNLTAATVAGATYDWQGPNGFTANTQNASIPGVTGIEAGMYTVTVTTGGCTSLGDSFLVVINNTPPSPNLTVNTPACTGDLVNFGSDYFGPGTYSWTGPNGFTSIDPNPFIGVATLIDNGVYNLVVSENGCNSAIATVNLVVNSTPPTPSATANSPVCATNTLTLATYNVPSAIYSWSGPNGFNSNTQNPSVPNVAQVNAGQYSVSVIVNGCISDEDTITVDIIDVPLGVTAFSNSPICVGEDLHLTTTGLPQGQFTWIGPNGFVSGQSNISITPAFLPKAGQYNVMYYSSQCTVALATVNVIINPLPPQPIITMVSGFLTSSISTNIQWNLNNVPLVGAILPTLNPTINGYYTVTYTDPSTGCVSTSQAYYYLNLFVGLSQDEEAMKVLRIYPNPTQDVLNVKVDLPFIQEDVTLEIIDGLGKVVLVERIGEVSKSEFKVNLAHLSNGSYILRMSGSNLMMQARILKQ